MHELKVGNMSCNHCVGTVTKSVLGVDPNAKVEINLAEKQVKVESQADLAQISAAINEAGYPVLSSRLA
jgi:copper chaperone